VAVVVHAILAFTQVQMVVQVAVQQVTVTQVARLRLQVKAITAARVLRHTQQAQAVAEQEQWVQIQLAKIIHAQAVTVYLHLLLGQLLPAQAVVVVVKMTVQVEQAVAVRVAVQRLRGLERLTQAVVVVVVTIQVGQLVAQMVVQVLSF
jgi:hypothetical protein